MGMNRDSGAIPAQERREDGRVALCKAFRDDCGPNELGVAK